MDLLVALGIQRQERLALVGGGGKTGLAYALLEEGRRRGWMALFTTTTKLLSPETGDDAFIVGEVGDPALHRRMTESNRLLVARRWLDEWEDLPAGRQRKVGGFAAAEIELLFDNLDPDLALVEADGSRHRPFKAPAGYEPVLPPTTTLLVVVAGLSVLGQPLAEAAVHRPERVAELAGVPLGTPVGPALVASVLADDQGGLKGRPPAARAVAVLAQATAERLPAGREVSRRLLDTGRFERVLLVDLDDPAGAGEIWQGSSEGGLLVGPEDRPRVPAVVLAAGASRRMGQNKLLLPLAGRPLVAHAVAAALGSRAAEVWVVSGAEEDRVRAALAGQPVRFLANPAWSTGQAASLRAAVAAAPPWCVGLLFLAGDMPFVPPTHLDRLLACLRPGIAVVWSGYGDGRGIPALFGREAFAALERLQGDVGGRALAGRFAEDVVPADFPRLDVDTVEQYGQACEWSKK